MKELTLIAEIFPRGVALRLRREGGLFVVRWQYQQRPYQIQAPTLMDALKEALTAVAALQGQEGLL